ncbi:hypothetical protein [Demequina sp. NBRC 110055]|uniref:hypothetical protein n=1 Tax=Demequina sp. NBRC 110055 TaxID=1570344 RepID=UPI00118697BC|nr:hypothetical protein [Demequina sp. NBRC 110055]
MALATAVVVTAGCSGPSQAERAADQLPDLSADGFTAVGCDALQQDALADIEDPYVRECWTGSPDAAFDAVANDVIGSITAATDAEDVTAFICPDDVIIDEVAFACRAAYDDEVMYRVVASLPDPAAVMDQLSEDPTDDEIEQAAAGQPVEVVVQTEKTPEE